MDPATSTYNLHVVAGGAGLPSLYRTALASYLGAFFRVVGPFIHRRVQMGGTTTVRVAAFLEDPDAPADQGHRWALRVRISSAGDYKAVASDLPPSLDVDVISGPLGSGLGS